MPKALRTFMFWVYMSKDMSPLLHHLLPQLHVFLCGRLPPVLHQDHSTRKWWTRRISSCWHGFHFTNTANHWSTIGTCKQFIEKKLWPCYELMCKSLDVPSDQKLMWLIDCWSVHTSEDFLLKWSKDIPGIASSMFLQFAPIDGLQVDRRRDPTPHEGCSQERVEWMGLQFNQITTSDVIRHSQDWPRSCHTPTKRSPLWRCNAWTHIFCIIHAIVKERMGQNSWDLLN